MTVLAHQTIGNEKTLAEVVKARSAVQRTQNQIEKQSNAIAQEVWRAEDKVKAAKEAHKKATIELTQAELLEKEAKKHQQPQMTLQRRQKIEQQQQPRLRL